jgi:two-component system cell cycle sensor histidine kinase/response regulator CckA
MGMSNEAWLSAILRNMSDALIATDPERNIAFINRRAAELTGWDGKQATGKPLADVFPLFEEASGPTCGELNSIPVEVEFSAGPEEGSVIVTFRDISERRKAEKQNLQLQKMNSLALMATGLGRELAESQTRMDDVLQRLIAASKGPMLRLLGEGYQCSAEQQSIVQQLIRLGRTEAGQSAVVDLNSEITELEARFQKALGSRRSLKLNLQPGVSPIQTDPRDLRENLLRLIVSARQAMSEDGVVEISTMTIESGAQVVIRDTGKAIRPGARERVFDPYYQSRPGNGNPGFSLALVYQFVALSGGSIEVESAAGEGVSYLLRFPRHVV